MRTKTLLRIVVVAFIAVAGCSSSGSPEPETRAGGGGTSGGGGGGKQIASIPQLADGAIPESMVAGPGGVALTMIVNGGNQAIVTVTPTGSVATALTLSLAQSLWGTALDDQSVYYDAEVRATGPGTTSVDALFSVPIGGGTPVQLLVANSADLFQTFAFDTDTIYLAVANTGAGMVSSWVSSIQAVSKASPQLGTPVYTAAAGQTIDNLRLDGTTLYWSETDRSADLGSVTVRSATVGGVGGQLSPSSLGTLPSPALDAALVATAGTAIVANLAATSGADGGFGLVTGIYAFTTGGAAPAAVFSSGGPPVAAAAGQLTYNDYSGIARAPVTSSGVGAASTVVPGVTALQMASDSTGSVYYLPVQGSAIYKL